MRVSCDPALLQVNVLRLILSLSQIDCWPHWELCVRPFIPTFWTETMKLLTSAQWCSESPSLALQAHLGFAKWNALVNICCVVQDISKIGRDINILTEESLPKTLNFVPGWTHLASSKRLWQVLWSVFNLWPVANMYMIFHTFVVHIVCSWWAHDDVKWENWQTDRRT